MRGPAARRQSNANFWGYDSPQAGTHNTAALCCLMHCNCKAHPQGSKCRSMSKETADFLLRKFPEHGLSRVEALQPPYTASGMQCAYLGTTNKSTICWSAQGPLCDPKPKWFMLVCTGLLRELLSKALSCRALSPDSCACGPDAVEHRLVGGQALQRISARLRQAKIDDHRQHTRSGVLEATSWHPLHCLLLQSQCEPLQHAAVCSGNT